MQHGRTVISVFRLSERALPMKSSPIGAALVGLTLTLAAVGCGSSSGSGPFACVQNSQCNASAGGICVAPGHCAYPDSTCASGYRYGGQSGAASNLCVASDGGFTSPDMSVSNIDMGPRPDMSVSNIDMGLRPDMGVVTRDMMTGDTTMAIVGTSRFAFVGAGAVQSTSTNWRMNNSLGQGSPLGAGPSISTNFAVGQGVLGGK
jgi:hypothetical protein